MKYKNKFDGIATMDNTAYYNTYRKKPTALLTLLGLLFITVSILTGFTIINEKPAEQAPLFLQERNLESLEIQLAKRASDANNQDRDGMGGAYLPDALLPPVTYFNYTIKTGDSIHSIADKLGIDEVTIIKINNILIPGMIRLGSNLRIPNQDGIIVKTNSNSLEKVAKKYNFVKEELLRINSVDEQEKFTSLFVPGIHFNSVSKSLLLGEYFRRPAWGRFSSGFGMRRDPFTGRWSFHQGIDIKNRYGTRITAAAPGKVIFTGTVPIYGRIVKIQHTSGYVSYYGHLSRIYVRKNMWIPAGQIIGLMGSTGRSTGPHVHFEIRRYGRVVNPMKVTVF